MSTKESNTQSNPVSRENLIKFILSNKFKKATVNSLRGKSVGIQKAFIKRWSCAEQYEDDIHEWIAYGIETIVCGHPTSFFTACFRNFTLDCIKAEFSQKRAARTVELKDELIKETSSINEQENYMIGLLTNKAFTDEDRLWNLLAEFRASLSWSEKRMLDVLTIGNLGRGSRLETIDIIAGSLGCSRKTVYRKVDALKEKAHSWFASQE